MTRQLLLLLLLMLGVVALVRAESKGLLLADYVEIPADAVPPGGLGQMIGGGATIPVKLEPVDWSQLPPNIPEHHGSDSCSGAPALTLPSGDGCSFSGFCMYTNNMTNEVADPVLDCQWGVPTNPAGYRTVWYKFVAPVSGEVNILTTFTDRSDPEENYDTVVAVYHSGDGTCNTLSQLACSDDANGFFSEITMFVVQGQTYYVEVADWNWAINSNASLELGISINTPASFWQEVGSMVNARSRAVVVPAGDELFVFGGQSVVSGNPTRTGRSEKYNTVSNSWTTLVNMPGPDGLGYSNTTGAYIGGKIYVPAGYVGNNDAYDGTHWVYDIANNNWSTGPVAPWPNGVPYAWSDAVTSSALGGYFLTGGLQSGDPFTADGQPVGRLLFFRPSTAFWNPNLPDMSNARYAHAADLLNGNVCVAGGIGTNGTSAVIYRNAECYDASTGSWSPIASLNFARFMAGSAVGADGKWYVYGGVTFQSGVGFQEVTVTEMYDPAVGSWQILDSRYGVDSPGRAWLQGGFINDRLWIVGGERPSSNMSSNTLAPIVEQIYLPHLRTFFPTFAQAGDAIEPNDTFETARPISLHIAQSQDFSETTDFFDVYAVQLTAPRILTAIVSNIPSGSDYDVYIYSSNKFLWAFGGAIGNNNDIATTQTLPAGTYYIVVLRTFGPPTTQTYQILVYD